MKEWQYTVSKNGRHQISEVGGGNVCMIWNCKDKERNANKIAAVPDMIRILESLVNPENCKKDIIHIIGNAESLLAKLGEQ